MTPVEAAKYLMELSRNDLNVRNALMNIIDNSDAQDIPEWVDTHPEQGVAIAVNFQDVLGQFKNFDDLLASGNLS